MKRNIYAFVLLLLSISCGPSLPPKPSQEYEKYAKTVPFACYYLGFIVLEGYLLIDAETAEKYETDDYVDGTLACNSEHARGFRCEINY